MKHTLNNLQGSPDKTNQNIKNKTEIFYINILMFPRSDSYNDKKKYPYNSKTSSVCM